MKQIIPGIYQKLIVFVIIAYATARDLLAQMLPALIRPQQKSIPMSIPYPI